MKGRVPRGSELIWPRLNLLLFRFQYRYKVRMYFFPGQPNHACMDSTASLGGIHMHLHLTGTRIILVTSREGIRQHTLIPLGFIHWHWQCNGTSSSGNATTGLHDLAKTVGKECHSWPQTDNQSYEFWSDHLLTA
jgi:hypothetical protein